MSLRVGAERNENNDLNNESAPGEGVAEATADGTAGDAERVSNGNLEKAVPEVSSGVRTGTVKWFNSTKGFGFITPDDGSPDIFVHQSVVKIHGFRSLAEKEKVEFVVEVGSDNRMKASKCTGPGGVDCKGASPRFPFPKPTRDATQNQTAFYPGGDGYSPQYYGVGQYDNNIQQGIFVADGYNNVPYGYGMYGGYNPVAAATAAAAAGGVLPHMAPMGMGYGMPPLGYPMGTGMGGMQHERRKGKPYRKYGGRGPTIYVGNLPYSVNWRQLKEVFAPYNCSFSDVKMDFTTGQSKGFAILSFPSQEDAEQAVTEMNGKELEGRAMTVKIDKGPPHQQQQRQKQQQQQEQQQQQAEEQQEQQQAEEPPMEGAAGAPAGTTHSPHPPTEPPPAYAIASAAAVGGTVDGAAAAMAAATLDDGKRKE